MTRDDIFKEMENTFGEVPLAFKFVPDPYLEPLWTVWKNMYTQETAIPNKYKELIGLAVASAIGDELDPYYYTQSAKMYGATDAEIQEVAVITRIAVGWMPYFRANLVDKDQYKREALETTQYMKSLGMAKAQTIPKPSM